jgi:capsid protein
MLALLFMLASTTFIAEPAGVADASAQFSAPYDATNDKGHRKAAVVRHGTEDRLLDPSHRAKLVSGAREMRRNFSVVAWAIRRHLDYVASFEFHCRTDDDSFNDEVETFVRDVWSRPYNFDAAGRHSLRKMIRIGEAMRTVDGDFAFMKLADGSLQGIEGDRIRNEYGQGQGDEEQATRWLHGVKVNRAGRALAYAIHRRNGINSFTLDRTVAASNIAMLGYYDRVDQVRGVSPLASGLNGFVDVYEGLNYALVKAKISQLFALAFYRDANESAGQILGETDDLDGDGDETTEDKAGYRVDFGRGPLLLDLEPGDRAEVIESAQPATQWQEFEKLSIMIALKSLDMPYSFFDEKHTNFFGSRGAWLHYERSCNDKRQDLADLLRRLTVWRLTLAIIDADLTLPSGWTLGDVHFEWVPTGMPWWDPAKEIRGDLLAIGAGLDNPQRICKERGRGDFYDNIDEIAKAKKYAVDNGVELSFSPVSEAEEVIVEPSGDEA